MKLTSEITQAKTWFTSWKEEDQTLLLSLEQKIVQSICEESAPKEKPLLIDIFGQFVQESMGSFRSIVLSDRKRIEEALHVNLLLVLFRLSLERHSIPAIMDILLSILEQYFFYFQKFLDHALKKGAQPFFIDEVVAKRCSQKCVSVVLDTCFPEKEKSLFLPVPSFFQPVFQSYVKGAFPSIEEKASSFLSRFFCDRLMKENLFASIVLSLHRALCSWDTVFPKSTVSKDDLLPFQGRAEALFVQMVSCLASKPTKTVQYFPKIQASPLLLSILWNISKKAQLRTPLLIVKACTHLLNIPFQGLKSEQHVSLESVENQIFKKASYGPLFFRFIGSSSAQATPTVKTSPIESELSTFFSSLAEGFMASFAYKSFDNLPWDDFFQMASFGLRRMWNYGLSQETLLLIESTALPGSNNSSA